MVDGVIPRPANRGTPNDGGAPDVRRCTRTEAGIIARTDLEHTESAGRARFRTSLAGGCSCIDRLARALAAADWGAAVDEPHGCPSTGPGRRAGLRTEPSRGRAPHEDAAAELWYHTFVATSRDSPTERGAAHGHPLVAARRRAHPRGHTRRRARSRLPRRPGGPSSSSCDEPASTCCPSGTGRPRSSPGRRTPAPPSTALLASWPHSRLPRCPCPMTRCSTPASMSPLATTRRCVCWPRFLGRPRCSW